jgi:hypothetical protein
VPLSRQLARVLHGPYWQWTRKGAAKPSPGWSPTSNGRLPANARQRPQAPRARRRTRSAGPAVVPARGVPWARSGCSRTRPGSGRISALWRRKANKTTTAHRCSSRHWAPPSVLLYKLSTYRCHGQMSRVGSAGRAGGGFLRTLSGRGRDSTQPGPRAHGHMADRQDHKAGGQPDWRMSGDVCINQDNQSVKPSAQPTQVRTLHLPLPAETVPGLRLSRPAGRLLVVPPCCVMCRRGAPCRSGCGHIADGSGAEGAVRGTAGSGAGRPGAAVRWPCSPQAGPSYGSGRGRPAGAGTGRGWPFLRPWSRAARRARAGSGAAGPRGRRDGRDVVAVPSPGRGDGLALGVSRARF